MKCDKDCGKVFVEAGLVNLTLKRSLLTFFSSDSCDNNCPSNARCENGVCYCNDGYEADQNCQKQGANNLACTLNQCIPVKSNDCECKTECNFRAYGSVKNCAIVCSGNCDAVEEPELEDDIKV